MSAMRTPTLCLRYQGEANPLIYGHEGPTHERGRMGGHNPEMEVNLIFRR